MTAVWNTDLPTDRPGPELRNSDRPVLRVLVVEDNPDAANTLARLETRLHAVGPARFANELAALSPEAARALERAPRPLDERGAAAALERFVTLSTRDAERHLASLSTRELMAGLSEVERWLSGARPSGVWTGAPSWIERFFGNTTVVRNFLVTSATLSALGTSLGIAAATCSTAPLVPVLGGLIGLVALLNQG